MNKFDPYKEALFRVQSAASRFLNAPRRQYLESLAQELSKRLKLPEIDTLLQDIHKKHNHFPTTAMFEAEIKAIEKDRWVKNSKGNMVRRVLNGNRWVSDKAPGTPITAEALFILMQTGQSSGGAFDIARAGWRHLSDEQVWAAFDLWLNGKVAPCLLDPKPAHKPTPKPEPSVDDLFSEEAP